MGEVVIKTGVDFKIRTDWLYGFDQFSGVVHTGDGVFDADDVAVFFCEAADNRRADGVACAVREVVDIYRSMDLSCHAAVKIIHFVVSEAEIERRYDHNGVCSCIQASVGKRRDFLCDHVCCADDDFHAACDAFDCKTRKFFALLQCLSKKFSEAASDQNAVDVVGNQIVIEAACTFKINGTVLVERCNCRANPFCIHCCFLLFFNRVPHPA